MFFYFSERFLLFLTFQVSFTGKETVNTFFP